MAIYALLINVVHARIYVFRSVIPVVFGIICIGFCDKRNYTPMREGMPQYTPLETMFSPLSFLERTQICTD